MLEIVGSELDAVMVCSILHDAGVQCMHRVTNFGSGAMDGLTIGGPREIVVHPEQLQLARRVMRDQRDGPRSPAGKSRSEAIAPQPPARPVATEPVGTPEDCVAGSVF